MKVLFDQGVPVPLRKRLANMRIETAFERAWGQLKNGELIAASEAEGFDVLLTTDQNLQYQQNLTERKVAVVVLKSTSWPRIQKCVQVIEGAIQSARIGSYVEVDIP
jgi:predicted nuclease of predicted toxin-antitoxin system